MAAVDNCVQFNTFSFVSFLAPPFPLPFSSFPFPGKESLIPSDCPSSVRNPLWQVYIYSRSSLAWAILLVLPSLICRRGLVARMWGLQDQEPKEWSTRSGEWRGDGEAGLEHVSHMKELCRLEALAETLSTLSPSEKDVHMDSTKEPVFEHLPPRGHPCLRPQKHS